MATIAYTCLWLSVLDFCPDLPYCPRKPDKYTRKLCSFVSRITKSLERVGWFLF